MYNTLFWFSEKLYKQLNPHVMCGTDQININSGFTWAAVMSPDGEKNSWKTCIGSLVALMSSSLVALPFLCNVQWFVKKKKKNDFPGKSVLPFFNIKQKHSRKAAIFALLSSSSYWLEFQFLTESVNGEEYRHDHSQCQHAYLKNDQQQHIDFIEFFFPGSTKDRTSFCLCCEPLSFLTFNTVYISTSI